MKHHRPPHSWVSPSSLTDSDVIKLLSVKKRLLHKIIQIQAFKSHSNDTRIIKHVIDMTSDQADMDSSPPAWFLDSCVKTVQDLAECDIPLIVRDNVTSGHGCNQELSELDAVVYEVDSAVYEPLQRLLFPKTSDLVEEHPSDLLPARRFVKNSVHLHSPDTTGGSHFLTAVVERFASDARADIITLGLDDVNDLFDRHGLSCCALAGINSAIYGTTGEQSERQSHTLDDNESRHIKEAQVQVCKAEI